MMPPKRARNKRIVTTASADLVKQICAEILENHPEAQRSVTIIINGNVHYAAGDLKSESYRADQAVAQGPHAHTHDIVFQQWWQRNEGQFDLSALAAELEHLEGEMQKRAKQSDQFRAIAEIQDAAEAAKNETPSKLFKHLSTAGSWALDVAKDIGSSVAAQAIAASVGIL